MNIWTKLKIKWWQLLGYTVQYRLRPYKPGLDKYCAKLYFCHEKGLDQSSLGTTKYTFNEPIGEVSIWVPVKTKFKYDKVAYNLGETQNKAEKFPVKVFKLEDYRTQLRETIKNSIKEASNG